MRDFGWQVEGVEVDSKAVSQARRQRLIIHQGTLEDQEFPEKIFDAVTMNHVIEHVHDPIALLRECYRVLKPKGYLVITTPNPSGWGHRIFQEHWRDLDPPRHLFLFTPQAMRNLMGQAGFTPINLRTSAAMAPSIFLASRRIRRRGNHDRNLRPTAGERILSTGFAFLENWRLKVEPEGGEELIVIGRMAE